MPSVCPRCSSPWNLQQTLPLIVAPAIKCGTCGWSGRADDLAWLATDEVEDEEE